MDETMVKMSLRYLKDRVDATIDRLEDEEEHYRVRIVTGMLHDMIYVERDLELYIEGLGDKAAEELSKMVD